MHLTPTSFVIQFNESLQNRSTQKSYSDCKRNDFWIDLHLDHAINWTKSDQSSVAMDILDPDGDDVPVTDDMSTWLKELRCCSPDGTDPRLVCLEMWVQFLLLESTMLFIASKGYCWSIFQVIQSSIDHCESKQRKHASAASVTWNVDLLGLWRSWEQGSASSTRYYSILQTTQSTTLPKVHTMVLVFVMHSNMLSRHLQQMRLSSLKKTINIRFWHV